MRDKKSRRSCNPVKTEADLRARYEAAERMKSQRAHNRRGKGCQALRANPLLLFLAGFGSRHAKTQQKRES